MKNINKIHFFFFLFMFLIGNLYASGNAEQQSEALLYKQKRATWENAPNSAAFYECYIVNIKDTKGNNKQILLDVYEYNNTSIKEGILLINPDTSMELIITNEILLKEKTIYKCIVLYTNSMLGIAMVNIFVAEPTTRLIGYAISDKINYYFDDEELNTIYRIFYVNDEGKLFYNNEELDYNKYSYAFFPNSKRSILRINWLYKTELKVYDGLVLIETTYNQELKKINDNLSLINSSYEDFLRKYLTYLFFYDSDVLELEMKRYLNERRKSLFIQDFTEQKSKLQIEYNELHNILSRYNLLRL